MMLNPHAPAYTPWMSILGGDNHQPACVLRGSPSFQFDDEDLFSTFPLSDEGMVCLWLVSRELPGSCAHTFPRCYYQTGRN